MITLTEIPFVQYKDYLYADKSLVTTNTIYCQKTTAYGSGKYDSVKQSYIDGSIFTAFNSKTEGGAMTGSFNLTTGVWTCPANGWYYIQSYVAYLINTGNIYSFQSSNANTIGQYFMLTAGVNGQFSLSNSIDANNTFGVVSKTLSQTDSTLYLWNSQLVQIPSGTPVRVVYTNNTDLALYGQSFASMNFKAIKLASY